MKGHGARKPCRQLGCFGYLAFSAGAIAALIAEVVTRHAAPRVKVGADDGHRLEATGHHRLEGAVRPPRGPPGVPFGPRLP